MITKLQLKSNTKQLIKETELGDWALQNEYLSFKGLLDYVDVGNAKDPTKIITDWHNDVYSIGTVAPLETSYTCHIMLDDYFGVEENKIYYLLVHFVNGTNAIPLMNFSWTVQLIDFASFKVPENSIRFWNGMACDIGDVYKVVDSPTTLESQTRYDIEEIYYGVYRFVCTLDYELKAPDGADTIIIPFKISYANSNKVGELIFKFDFNVPEETKYFSN